MDALPSRFINRYQTKGENEVDMDETNDFDFNQDNSINLISIEVLVGIDIKNKLIKWKK